MEANCNGENIRTLSLGELVEEFTSCNDDENTAWEGEDEICPKCGEILMKDENGECIECKKPKYFVVDVSKEKYELIKKGDLSFVTLPIQILRQESFASMSIDKNFKTTFKIKYGIVKVCDKNDSKRFMIFFVHAIRFYERSIEDETILLFLGKQTQLEGEECDDICDVDMERKSIEFLEKHTDNE